MGMAGICGICLPIGRTLRPAPKPAFSTTADCGTDKAVPMRQRLRNADSRSRCGFTLVEVLIVVVILGILASVVLPQFTYSQGDAQETAVMRDLRTLRTQIRLYTFQHSGRLPAEGTTDPQAFEDALLLSSDVEGTTAADGSLSLGPYITGKLPPNPYNGLRTVRVVDSELSSVTPDGSTGWIYSSRTGWIRANSPLSVTNTEGTPIYEL